MAEEQKIESTHKESMAQKPKGKAQEESTHSQQTVPTAPDEKKFEGYLSEVVELAGRRTGIYGEIKQAMCKILEGKDKGRVIRRNIAGRIEVGDIIRLPDTSREDKPIRSR